MRAVPIQDRFWTKVNILGLNDCWEWIASKNHQGYGTVRVGFKIKKTHRVAWELINGPIKSEEIKVCHSCDNPSCVNPNHLFLGTQLDNVHDTILKNRHFQKNQTHCKRNHEFIQENTIVNSTTKARACRICFNMTKRLWRKRIIKR